MDNPLGIDPGISELLKKSPFEEIDYDIVMDALKIYKHPRVKLNYLLKIGALVRIKKGIYIFGTRFSRRPFSPQVLANMIYGPSYLSLEWACSYYHLIPEKVVSFTSVTTKRSKSFQTPIGTFTYDHLPLKSYAVGMTLKELSDGRSYLIASKEKALVDLLVIRRGLIRSNKELKEILYEDLRLEEEDVRSLEMNHLKEIYQAKPHSIIKYLIESLK